MSNGMIGDSEDNENGDNNDNPQNPDNKIEEENLENSSIEDTINTILSDSEQADEDSDSKDIATEYKKRAANQTRTSIHTTYKNVVTNVKETLDEDEVVDLELTFKSVKVSRKGIPIITTKRESSELEIRLATRITGQKKLS